MAIPTSYPPFVGYYFDFDRRILFTATTASVYSLQKKTTAIFPFVLPRIPDSPEDDALFAKKKIKHLLCQGYVPALFGSDITLVSPERAFWKESFLCSCESESRIEQLTNSSEKILKATKDIRFVRISLNSSSEEIPQVIDDEEIIVGAEPNPALGHLAEFVYHIQQKDFDTARGSLDAAVTGFEGALEYNQLRELQADFFYFRGYYKAAAEIYEELASEVKNKKMLYLECALRCCPTELKLYKKLKRLYSNEKILHLYLFAMQSFAKNSPTLADHYYEKALKLAPRDPIVHFARISCLEKEERVEKVLLYRKLAKVFKENKDQRLCLYYLNKNIFHSSEDLQEYLTHIGPCSAVRISSETEKERGCIELIDSFLRAQLYEQAEEAIKQAINNSIFTFEVLKRLFIVYLHREKTDLAEIAEKLALLEMK